MSNDNAQVTNIQGNPLLNWALFYLSQGYRLFLLEHGTKNRYHIKDKSWKEHATQDIKTVTRWCTQRPDANLAGIPPWHVLDVDCKPGKPDGRKALNGHIPESFPCAITPSGGWHIPVLTARNIKGIEGVDIIRAGKQYHLLCPSQIDGKPYQWLPGRTVGVEAPVQPLSADLSNLFPERSENPSHVDMPLLLEPAPPLPWEKLKAFQITFLKTGNIEDAQELRDQSGSGVVLSIASTLYRLGYDDPQVLSLLWANPFVHGVSTKGDRRGLDWLWHYNCIKARECRLRDVAEVFDRVEGASIPKAECSRYRLRSFADLATDTRMPEWLIDGYLPEAGVGILYGPPKSWKSFLMLDVAVSVVTGQEFHGHEVTGSGWAAYLAGEGAAGLNKRLSAQAKFRGFTVEQLRGVYVSEQALDLTAPTQGILDPVFDMLDQIQEDEGNPPRLIVVDTLSKHLLGDENSSKDVSAFLNRMDALRERYGCMVVVVHHTGHGTAERARGSSALRANVDVEYSMIPDENGVSVLCCEKMKDDEEPPPIAFQAHKVVLEDMRDRKGRAKDSLALTAVQGYRSPKEERSNKNRKQIRVINGIKELIGENLRGTTTVAEMRLWLQEQEGENPSQQLSNVRRRLKSLADAAVIVMQGDSVWFQDTITKPEQPFQPL